jgi:hypothetical protein
MRLFFVWVSAIAYIQREIDNFESMEAKRTKKRIVD